MKESRDGGRTVVEHTSPIWRVLSVALAAGSVAAVGYYLQEIGHADDFAYVLVVTMVVGVGFWARRRPDRLQRRLGPFAKIATAIRESQDDIRAWVYARPLAVGLGLAACYGIALVVAQNVVVALLAALYSPFIAVALGCAVGAAVAAPEFISSLLRRLALPPEETHPQQGAAAHPQDGGPGSQEAAPRYPEAGDTPPEGKQ